jgi:hypothetical protein
VRDRRAPPTIDDSFFCYLWCLQLLPSADYSCAKRVRHPASSVFEIEGCHIEHQQGIMVKPSAPPIIAESMGKTVPITVQVGCIHVGYLLSYLTMSSAVPRMKDFLVWIVMHLTAYPIHARPTLVDVFQTKVLAFRDTERTG